MDYFVICPGPSLTREDCDLVREWRGDDPSKRVIVVNRAWEYAPWADILYAGDAMYWNYKPYREAAFAGFKGEKWTASPSASKIYGLNLLKSPLLTNSGANAIALAQRHDARRIYLLGMDYSAATDGRIHCHEDHPEPLYNYGTFEVPEIQRLALELKYQKVEVVNCSRRTKLACFERLDWLRGWLR